MRVTRQALSSLGKPIVITSSSFNLICLSRSYLSPSSKDSLFQYAEQIVCSSAKRTKSYWKKRATVESVECVLSSLPSAVLKNSLSDYNRLGINLFKNKKKGGIKILTTTLCKGIKLLLTAVIQFIDIDEIRMIIYI